MVSLSQSDSKSDSTGDDEFFMVSSFNSYCPDENLEALYKISDIRYGSKMFNSYMAFSSTG